MVLLAAGEAGPGCARLGPFGSAQGRLTRPPAPHELVVLGGCGSLRLVEGMGNHRGDCGQSEHEGGEKQVTCQSAAEEWKAGGVASHKAWHSFRIHVPARP